MPFLIGKNPCAERLLSFTYKININSGRLSINLSVCTPACVGACVRACVRASVCLSGLRHVHFYPDSPLICSQTAHLLRPGFGQVLRVCFSFYCNRGAGFSHGIRSTDRAAAFDGLPYRRQQSGFLRTALKQKKMKALDEYIQKVLFALLLKRVHFLVNQT